MIQSSGRAPTKILFSPHPPPLQANLRLILQALLVHPQLDAKGLRQLLGRYPQANGALYRKSELLQAYRIWQSEITEGDSPPPLSPHLLALLQKKPTRTISGVTPITVLTKPFPCPGECIFCPNDIRMPKSYLAEEPGAQRAERHWFDPYLQTYSRLEALQTLGHPVTKAELIVLGGTWSFYPESYQIWFIKEIFRALNDFGQRDGRGRRERRYHRQRLKYQDQGYSTLSNQVAENERLAAKRAIRGTELTHSYNQVISEFYLGPERAAGFDRLQTATWSTLERVQRENERATVRCVGLVLETRPDNISLAEVRRLRRLGCTKVQIGVQSLQDEVLRLNRRGHSVAATRRAFCLLRQAGFKIHAHWMANLYGSSPVADQADFTRLFTELDFRPDELKIYPCSLLESAELMQYYQRGEWQPYTRAELLAVLSHALRETPRYCRLTRVIRDIPSTKIVTGNKTTNFREVVEREMKRKGWQSVDIRAREIRGQAFLESTLKLASHHYQTSVSEEVFFEFTAQAGDDGETKLLAFLRLSLPRVSNAFPELKEVAMIREVHVYGGAVELGRRDHQRAQHLGLGKKLILTAKRWARERGWTRLAVISAVGTRQYYARQGFKKRGLYQFCAL